MTAPERVLTTEHEITALFEQMLMIRVAEETLLQLFSQGILNGTVHTCIGQEGCAVGVVSALDKSRDIICSNHRGHGHFLAYSEDVEGLIAEVMGKATGVCGGIGGTQHLHKKNFYSNGILGGMIPVATGMALAEKKKGSNAVVVIFFGDGAFGEGVLYESFNIASLWELPILFAVEHNGYAQSTPTHLEQAGELQTRGHSFGITSTEVDGNDVLAVYRSAREIVESVRSEQKPQILFMRTYRLAPHSKGDDLREPAEIEAHRKRDPILLAGEFLDAARRVKAEREIQERVSNAVALARQAPLSSNVER